MSKIVLVVLLSALVINIAACSTGNEADSTKKTPTAGNKSAQGDAAKGTHNGSSTPVADSLKRKKLNAYSSKTVGEAFDSYKYAIKKEWREAGTRSGIYYVDYTCWFDTGPLSPAALTEGIVKRGLEIKFVIHEDGEANIAMATRIEIKSDGKSYATYYDVADIKKIVAAIYENREIAL